MKIAPSIITMAILSCFISTSAMATLTANDDTNKIEGTYSNALMRSTDNGKTWLELKASDETSKGINNDFPGTETVVVANKLPEVITTPLYDPTQTYSTANTKVRYNGYYWTNQWWANPGEIPGSNSVWLKGAATTLEDNVIASYNFTPWQGQQAEDYQTQQKDKVAKQTRIYGYYPEWGVYAAHNYFTPDKIAWDQLTHISYAFGVVKNGVVVTHDTEKGPELMREIATASKQAGVKNILSVGGWTNSEEGGFEAATTTAEGVEKLAQSIVDYAVEWKFDGVDIDWEYPDTDAEKTQFTNLITSLRSKLDMLGKQNDIYYQLSAAVTVNHNNMAYINPKATITLLDSVNVMAYDIHGAFDPVTGHNAALYANDQDEDQKLNVSSAMNEYATIWGVPKNKLTMGVPFYGRGWGNVEPTEIVKGLPGLFAQGNATVHGAWDDEDQYTGTNPFYVLQQKIASGDYTRYWDPQAHVPYLYDAKTKEFLTYDDEASITDKVNYIKEQGFGGVIIWDISGDSSDHALGKIVATLKPTDSDDNDDGDDDGGDSDSSVVSYVTVKPGAGNSLSYNDATALFSFIPGVYFELPYEDFQNGTFDVRVNNVSIAKLVNGTASKASIYRNGQTVQVTTDTTTINEGDVVSVVRQDSGEDILQISTTATKQMLGDAMLVDGNMLKAVYVSRLNGYTAIQLVTDGFFNNQYQVYLNDQFVASVTTKTAGSDTLEHMKAAGKGQQKMVYATTKDIVPQQDDVVKVYQNVGGNKTLVAQLTIPRGTYTEYY